MKRVFITGGSRGIGGAIAKKFACNNYKTILLSRTESELKKQCEELNDAYPLPQDSHEYIQFDLSKVELINTISAKLEDVDILINCAGISQNKLLINEPEDEIQKIINTNLVAPIILSKIFIKNIMKRKRKQKLFPFGYIFNISSVLGASPERGIGATVYSSSKSGLIGFSKSINSEMRGRVDVISIEPTLVRDTKIGRDVNINGIGDENGMVTVADIADEVFSYVKNIS